MGLETGTYIDSLVATNPTSGDVKSEGDDHLRLIKSTIKATFAGVTGAVTPTHTELNFVDGVTSAIQTQMDLKAPLNSPTLTGTPLAPTAAADTNTTQVATTAFVTAAFIAGAYPTVSGNSGKFLTNDGTLTAWEDIYASVYTQAEVDAMYGVAYVPVIASGDAGKVLRVNSGETALEYVATSAAIRYEELSVISTFSGALSLDANDADVFYIEVSSLGEPTITPSNIPVGGRIRVVISAADLAVITWAAMAWPGGSPPTNSGSSHPDVYYIENHPPDFGSNSDNYQAYRVATDIY